jgi:hypothetical protein
VSIHIEFQPVPWRRFPVIIVVTTTLGGMMVAVHYQTLLFALVILEALLGIAKGIHHRYVFVLK